MSRIKRFFFGLDDWNLIWHDSGQFVRYGFSGQTTETAIYKILFSPSRNRYKLKVSGFHPRGHTKYGEAIDKLNHFESQL